MSKTVKHLIVELETGLAKILINIETLQYIQMEFARVVQQIDRKKEKISFFQLPNYSTLFVIDELLFYTVKEIMTNYEAISIIIEKIHTKFDKGPSQ